MTSLPCGSEGEGAGYWEEGKKEGLLSPERSEGRTFFMREEEKDFWKVALSEEGLGGRKPYLARG